MLRSLFHAAAGGWMGVLCVVPRNPVEVHDSGCKGQGMFLAVVLTNVDLQVRMRDIEGFCNTLPTATRPKK